MHGEQVGGIFILHDLGLFDGNFGLVLFLLSFGAMIIFMEEQCWKYPLRTCKRKRKIGSNAQTLIWDTNDDLSSF